MGKVTKADLKVQREVQELLNLERNLTEDEVEFCYEHYNPSMDSSITEAGVFFTPIGLAGDFAIFAHKQSHLVDVCSGIGILAWKCLNYDYYHCNIRSMTLIEFNPRFCEIAKKLLSNIKNEKGEVIPVNVVCASAFDKDVWAELTKDLPDNRFNTLISNPPFGKIPSYQKEEANWLNYVGDRECMVMELCLRYAKQGHFIIPPSSCEFKFSGRPYYERTQSKKIDKLRVSNPESFFYMEADGIDCSIYVDEWKNTKINVEVASFNMNAADYA